MIRYFWHFGISMATFRYLPCLLFRRDLYHHFVFLCSGDAKIVSKSFDFVAAFHFLLLLFVDASRILLLFDQFPDVHNVLLQFVAIGTEILTILIEFDLLLGDNILFLVWVSSVIMV